MRLVRAVRGLFVVVRSHMWVGRGKADLTFALAFMESPLLLLSASTRSILADGPFQQTGLLVS
jgi:hypothetical protein